MYGYINDSFSNGDEDSGAESKSSGIYIVSDHFQVKFVVKGAFLWFRSVSTVHEIIDFTWSMVLLNSRCQYKHNNVEKAL